MRCIIILFLAIIHCAEAQVWQQLPDFPGTARDDAASFVIGEYVYVGTGMEVGWGLTNDWFRFNTVTEAWEPIAALPASPRQYCSGFTVDGLGYVFGGLDANGALAELWMYDPQLNVWTQKASLPAEARSACAASEGFGYGIVATGMLASGSPTNEAWKYYPQTDFWEMTTPVPGPARHRAAGYLGSGGMVIAGGADANFQALDDVHWYPVFFETGEWYPLPPLPAPRYGLRGASFEVVIGGASDTTVLHDDVWRSTADWEALPAFSGGARRGGIAAGMDNAGTLTTTVYFGMGIGPLADDFVRYKDWWKLTYATEIPELSGRSFNVFPNPVTDRIIIPDHEAKEFVLQDVLGKTVMTGKVRNGGIDVAELNAGRYFLFLSNGERTLRSSFIKLP
jgi:hypothetical protein